MSKALIPTFRFDLTEDADFQKAYALDDDRQQEWANEAAWTEVGVHYTAERFDELLEPFVTDDDERRVLAGLLNEDTTSDPDDLRVMAEVAAKYKVDEIRLAIVRGISDSYETAMRRKEDDLHQALEDALPSTSTEMYGINTAVYWCGVLAAWPWSDITSDEDAVIDEVLKHARVEGTSLVLSYHPTKYRKALHKVAREDDGREPNYGFGGNSEMELGTIARHVFGEAIKRLEAQVYEFQERGWDAQTTAADIKAALTEHFEQEAQ